VKLMPAAARSTFISETDEDIHREEMPDPRQAAYGKRWTLDRAFCGEGPMAVRSCFLQIIGACSRWPSEWRNSFRKSNSILLVASGGAPRGKLLDQFKTKSRSVFFGTDSFWMGVDVPGEALSNVIITRSPFACLTIPLVEAKLELIEERGGDPFTEIFAAEAILKLRQGVGRLIRTKSDHGIIVILDSRVLTSPMAGLPGSSAEVSGRSNLRDSALMFF